MGESLLTELDLFNLIECYRPMEGVTFRKPPEKSDEYMVMDEFMSGSGVIELSSKYEISPKEVIGILEFAGIL